MIGAWRGAIQELMLDMIFAVFLPCFLLLVVVVATLEWREGQAASAKARWPVNIALILMASGLAALVPVSSFSAAYWARDAEVGLLNLVGFGGALAFAMSFAFQSFWYFLVHIASHKIPFLWRFHKVHHSDYDLDVTTTFRVHPLIYLATVLMNALVVVAMGLQPEAIIAHAMIVLLIDVWHHTSLRSPAVVETTLRPYLITPNLHRLHHSDYVSETETNFGHDLAIWDRIFGTYLANPKRSEQDFHYGLTQYPRERANNLDAQLLAPFGKGANS